MSPCNWSQDLLVTTSARGPRRIIPDDDVRISETGINDAGYNTAKQRSPPVRPSWAGAHAQRAGLKKGAVITGLLPVM
jgi:hypothetical protein